MQKKYIGRLLYRHSQGKCSNELHSLISQVQTFTARTGHAASMKLNHPHFPRVPFINRKCPLRQLFTKNATLWNIPFHVVIYVIYPHNFSLPHTSFIHVPHTPHHYHFNCNLLPCFVWGKLSCMKMNFDLFYLQYLICMTNEE